MTRRNFLKLSLVGVYVLAASRDTTVINVKRVYGCRPTRDKLSALPFKVMRDGVHGSIEQYVCSLDNYNMYLVDVSDPAMLARRITDGQTNIS